jgi:hypothetical protein
MTHHIEFTCSLPERGIDPFNGFYSIEGGQARLFLPANPSIPSIIRHLDCAEIKRQIHSQFINCTLNRVGSDVYEFIAEAAFIGETFTSYKVNKYTKCEFIVSNDILAFLSPTWDFLNDFFDTESRHIKFTPRDQRNRVVVVNESIQFKLESGYSQSYSNVRYKIKASALFHFYFQNIVTRDAIYDLIDSILDFYSLFFEKPLTLQSMRLVTSENIVVGYQGTKLTPAQEGEFFSNNLIEESYVSDHLDHVGKWINAYSKNQVSLRLIRDASKLMDEQLRFICFIRCLEVFHKENFVTISNPAVSYYEELHAFALNMGIIDVPLKGFISKEIRLIHRLLDLIRSIHELIKKDRLMFGFFTSLNRPQEIVDTRNYFIHFSDSKKTKAFSSDQLPHINYSLLLFCRIILLKHFGFREATIKSLISAASRRLFGN